MGRYSRISQPQYVHLYVSTCCPELLSDLLENTSGRLQFVHFIGRYLSKPV
ncbi:MAG TPA: hypothetical protein VH677_03365 [Nitrososphaera sp.]